MISVIRNAKKRPDPSWKSLSSVRTEVRGEDESQVDDDEGTEPRRGRRDPDVRPQHEAHADRCVRDDDERDADRDLEWRRTDVREDRRKDDAEESEERHFLEELTPHDEPPT